MNIHRISDIGHIRYPLHLYPQGSYIGELDNFASQLSPSFFFFFRFTGLFLLLYLGSRFFAIFIWFGSFCFLILILLFANGQNWYSCDIFQKYTSDTLCNLGQI